MGRQGDGGESYVTDVQTHLCDSLGPQLELNWCPSVSPLTGAGEKYNAYKRLQLLGSALLLAKLWCMKMISKKTLLSPRPGMVVSHCWEAAPPPGLKSEGVHWAVGTEQRMPGKDLQR